MQSHFVIDDGYEFTIEANPTDIDELLCKHLNGLGVNRVSIGVQSLDDEKLISLDRQHDASTAFRAVDTATKYFKNVSLDLMFAAPKEHRDTWANDLLKAKNLGVQHISTYGLTIEKGTQFWNADLKNLLRKPGEAEELWMYEHAIDFLQSEGFEHYEVSNFAVPGRDARTIKCIGSYKVGGRRERVQHVRLATPGLPTTPRLGSTSAASKREDSQ